MTQRIAWTKEELLRCSKNFPVQEQRQLEVYCTRHWADYIFMSWRHYQILPPPPVKGWQQFILYRTSCSPFHKATGWGGSWKLWTELKGTCLLTLCSRSSVFKWDNLAKQSPSRGNRSMVSAQPYPPRWDEAIKYPCDIQFPLFISFKQASECFSNSQYWELLQ